MPIYEPPSSPNKFLRRITSIISSQNPSVPSECRDQSNAAVGAHIVDHRPTTFVNTDSLVVWVSHFNKTHISRQEKSSDSVTTNPKSVRAQSLANNDILTPALWAF